MKNGKVWGTTTPLLVTPVLEVHQLSVFPEAACSLHKHALRWNAFYVTLGELYVDIHQQDYALVDTTALEAGDFTAVPPGLLHRFRTGAKGAELIELYYPAPLGANDIQREGVGSCGAPLP